MTIERKLLGTSPSGGATDVAEVFSTHLYTGNSATQTIVNGVDLSGEGGLVWLKWISGNNSFAHALYDSERGITKQLQSNTAVGETTQNRISSFNSSGFTLTSNTETNYSANKYASWTFRKKKKFFDIITYSGNSVAGRQISHALGGPVGMIISKCTSEDGQYWHVFHRSAGHVSNAALHAGTVGLNLNTNGDRQIGSSDFWGGTLPTSTHFSVGAGNDSNNITGKTYVAYVFADNSAEDADDQMIECGSVVFSSGNNVLSLPWEPQFILIKSLLGSGDWLMMDTMRGLHADPSNGRSFFANDNSAETSGGLRINEKTEITLNLPNHDTYIYMAIRAPMMVEPEAATDVFAVEQGNASGSSTVMEFDSGFPVDFAITHDTSGSNHDVMTRLMGPYRLRTQLAEAKADTGVNEFASNIGYHVGSQGSLYIANMWKRAKGFFDVVTYTGSSSAGNLTINHSLGVPPELIISKGTSQSQAWRTVFNMNASTHQYFTTMSTAADYASGASYGSGYLASQPTSTTYVVRQDTGIGTGVDYVAYLFATLAGISKVGTYTGNGSSQTISCGFSAGSRFILIKSVNATGDWYVWDSVRGIVAGNDPHLSLNTTAAQVTNNDSIDPANAGFIVNQVSATNINVSSEEYLFYAIA